MSRSYVSANILFCDAEVGRSHNYINKIFLYQNSELNNKITIN